MNTKRMLKQNRFLLTFLAGVLVFSASVTRAQDAPANDANGNDSDNGNYNAQGEQNNGNYDVPDNGQDPPSRVARLSFFDGTVSFQPGGQGEWGAATRNRPVTVGDKIWVDNNSRAELQAGQASIHLSTMTALSFLNLDDQTTQMRLAEGTMNFRVRELREGDVYEVDTPNVAFNITQAGAFRVEVNENGDGTRITAIRGEAEVTTNGQTYTIHAGERGEFNGAEGNVTYFVAAAPAPDEFDRWSNDRDLRDDNSVSARYVSRDVPGYSDLDDNGTWNEEPDYGAVWYPSQVDVGWAPYSNGYWNYVGPWGWTWVGYEPWGFAPYHYGRWAFIGSRWGWCPGPYYARPIYGPAFVGFLGGGFGFGAHFGGGIGWFPLGFREPFHPWYHTSAAYYRNVNFSNTRFRDSRFLNNRGGNFNYAYAHNVRAVTIASRNNFVNGQAINRGAFRANEAALRGAQVSNRAGVSPTRQSYFGAAGVHGNISRPSAAIQNRAVMARTSPAAGASNSPVRTFGGVNSQAGRGGFNSAPAMGRAAQTNAAANRNRPPFAQSGQTSIDRPQSHMRSAPADSGVNNRGQANTGSPRNWAAQGNTTDRGRPPAGFGTNSGNANRPDRPAWAGSGNGNSVYSVNPRSSAPSNRPNYSSGNRGNSRSYEAPQRNYPGNSNAGGYSQPRSYNPPQRNYPSPSQPRSYSAPQRSYSPPSRGSSAPSHSSGGGGSHSSGGGASHSSGGGGSSHASGSPHGRS
jgi:hypothetical protein